MFFCCTHEPRPAGYDIQSTDEGATLIIKVRSQLWPSVLKLLSASPGRPLLEKNLGIPPFLAPSPLPWGFGPVFIEEPPDDPNWHSIRCELPRFFHWSYDDDWTETFRWKQAFGVSASIHWLLQCTTYASAQKTEFTDGLKQALEVYVGVHRDSDRTSCYISAGFSAQLCQWIMKQNIAELCTNITRRMSNAFMRMYGKDSIDSYDKYDLGAKVHESPHLIFSCPGDRCSLYPTLSSRQHPALGYELCDHNVDSPMQQLVLLIGVASLASYYYANQ